MPFDVLFYFFVILLSPSASLRVWSNVKYSITCFFLVVCIAGRSAEGFPKPVPSPIRVFISSLKFRSTRDHTISFRQQSIVAK
jgi:hypothetical protein